MKSLVVLSDKVDRDIEDTRNQAIGEISNIKNHASSIAQFEANNKINEVFDENNIDQYIEKIAKERMESKINDLVVSRLKTAQEEETDRAITYIKNPNDASNYTVGYYYFQNNTQTKLSDKQVGEIIEIIKSNSDPNLESILVSMLAYRASPTIRNFFVEEILKYPDGNVAMYYASDYLLTHDVEPDAVMQHLKYQISKGKIEHNFSAMIDKCQYCNNMPFVLRMLNDKELVEILVEKLPVEKFKALQKNVAKKIAFKFSNEVVQATHLFQVN